MSLRLLPAPGLPGRRAGALAAALLLAGCHRLLPGGVRCPDHGGTPWREYRSAHFLVYTDLAPAAAAGLVHDLEAIWAMEARAVAHPREIPGRLRAVAPAQERMYLAMSPPGVVGYYLVTGLGEPTVVLHPAAFPDRPEVVAHELAHHLSWHLFPRHPRWFGEGFAQFVQTVGDPDPRARGWAGRVPRAWAGRLPRVPRLSAREILRWDGAPDPRRPGLHEIWSWVLYHYLWSEHPGQLADYQRRLAAAEDPSAAFAAAFPRLDPADADALARLDEALDRHRLREDLASFRVSAEAATGFTEAPVSSADVHVLLVEARGYWSVSRHRLRLDVAGALGEAARLELEEALKEDPMQPRALSRLAELDGTPPVPLLRAAAAARPGDFSAWFLLGDALEDAGDAAGGELAYRTGAALNPDSAPTLNNLAWLLAGDGRVEEAHPLARRAVDLAPWNSDILDTLAVVLDGLGDCPGALRLERRAADLLTRGGREIRERVLELEGRCGAGPGTGAAPSTRTP